MKLSLPSLLLIGSALILPLLAVRADDQPNATAPSGGNAQGHGGGGGGCMFGGWHRGFGHGGGFGKQGGPGQGGPFAQLGLTDDQKQQIKQILSGSGDFKSKQQAIQNVLTPDQQAKVKEMFSHFRGGFGGGGFRGGWHRGGPGGKGGGNNSGGNTDSGSDSDAT